MATASKRPPRNPRPAPEGKPRGVPAKYDGRGKVVWALVYPPGKANANPKVTELGAINGDVRGHLPEGTVEWCREGDRRWTPYEEESR